MASYLFVHGVGGAKPATYWLDPVNRRMGEMGFEPINPALDRVVIASYADLVAAGAPESDITESRETYKKSEAKVRLQAELDYAARQQALERDVRRHVETANMAAYPLAPSAVAESAAAVAEFVAPVVGEVRRFLDSSKVRATVWQRLIGGLPDSEPLIVVGHSLGSIVAAGLLRRVPAGRKVDLFVTIGSPLWASRYRRVVAPLADEFPCEHVYRWLNVYSPHDGVAAGRGLARGFVQALDLAGNGSHAVEAYMSHPGVAAAFHHVVSEGAGQLEPLARPLARRMHASWFPLLLSSAFALQLTQQYSTREVSAKQRFDFAREEMARRAIYDITAQRATRQRYLEQALQLGMTVSEVETSDHPLANGRHPNERDLTVDAARLLRGVWQDDELLSYAVGLLIQPVVPPFDIRFDLDKRGDALENTLNVVRADRGSLADKTFAQRASESVEWARKKLSDSGGFPWGTVLIGAGLLVVAATGVGLAFAAPAGLAGAAVVTSTLAAFGPGGMVGGLLTLTALTGTASGLGAIGANSMLDQPEQVADATAAATQSGTALAAADPDALAAALTGMLAVVRAQAALDFQTTEPIVRLIIETASDIATSELHVHERVSPGRASEKLWERKAALFIRAIAALDSMADELGQVRELVDARRAIEAGPSRIED